MLGNLTGWHLVIILVVIVLLFGSTKLPAMRIFKGEVKTMKEESGSDRRDDVRDEDRHRADDRYRADDRARDTAPRDYVRPGEARLDEPRYDAPRYDSPRDGGDSRPSA
jgi:sec-independent protein translocase protein TatA